MDRVYDIGASASPPAAPASPSTGYPTAGNPSGGIAATKPGPWWYHMVTEELRAVVAAAGLTPDHLALNQLATAIAALSAVSAVPAGTVVYLAMSTVPAGWLKANGAAVSRATYAALFAAIGTTFGVGDGGTTFTLPDLRGEFIRGWDDGRGADAGRTLGSWQVATAFMGDGDGVNPGVPSLNDSTHKTVLGFDLDTAPANATGLTIHYCQTVSSAAGITGIHTDGGASTVTEFARTRPRNVALLACIKY